VHVGEANRRVPGQMKGHIAWHDVFIALHQANYQGYIVMEPFILMGIPSALNICVWRDMSEHADMKKLISDTHSGALFIRSHLTDS
jgi:D-psicose/D-tagatose/L-ribulose 3-epimerase